MVALYRQLANSYQVMLGETEGVYTEDEGAHPDHDSQLLQGLISQLMAQANDPPRSLNGMPDDYFDSKSSWP